MDQFNQFVTGGLTPDRTYLLELPASDAAARRDARSEADRMEAAGQDFYGRVAAGYRALADRHADRIVTLDAGREIDDLADVIRRDIDGLLGGR